MIAFNIYLSAKTVKEALKIRQELLDAGVPESSVRQVPMVGTQQVARIASPPSQCVSNVAMVPLASWRPPNGNVWELERHWKKMTSGPWGAGKNFRCPETMIAKYGLPNDRAGQIKKLCMMIASGEVVRTVTNPKNGGATYRFAYESKGGIASDTDIPDASDLDDVDPNHTV